MPRIEIPLADIPADRPLRVEYGEAGIVVIKTEEGVRAFEDTCPHAQWRLSDGDLIGNVLECPGHGWEFSSTSGRCINVPAYCLKPFRVTMRGDSVEIDVAFSADEAKEREAHDGSTAV
jgi:nitrite reductase/ring-hydroxylating ferredoxin subunit